MMDGWMRERVTDASKPDQSIIVACERKEKNGEKRQLVARVTQPQADNSPNTPSALLFHSILVFLFAPHSHSTNMKNQQLQSRHNHSQGSLFVLSTKSTGVIAAVSIGLAAAARPYGSRMTGQGLLLAMGALQCGWIGANLVTYPFNYST